MKLIDNLQDEHALIDRMLGALRSYVEALIEGAADPADGDGFVAFFTEFVGRFHDEREEQVLFEALVTVAELPRERGPVHAITQEHLEMKAWLREMTPGLRQRPQTVPQGQRLRAQVVRYTQALWRHVDAENSVLYPEGLERLQRCGVHELPERPMTAAEAAAHAGAAALLQRHPPREDASLTRGDGCYLCRAHGQTCQGLEAEWWSELEWDEFFER